LIIDTITVGQDIRFALDDQTRHYFGGYFHVKIMVSCDISLKRNYFNTDAEYDDAVNIMGESVRFERILEKMAVPETGIESVRNQLTVMFLESSKKYVSIPDFASRFVLGEYRKRKKNHGYKRCL
jgi:hypothetical protein